MIQRRLRPFRVSDGRYGRLGGRLKRPMIRIASAFGRNRRRALAVAERIEAGTVMVNEVMANYGFPEIPFGGIKRSGLGRTHGADGLRAMTTERVINIDRIRPRYRELWWQPYSGRLARRVLAGMRRWLAVLDWLPGS